MENGPSGVGEIFKGFLADSKQEQEPGEVKPELAESSGMSDLALTFALQKAGDDPEELKKLKEQGITLTPKQERIVYDADKNAPLGQKASELASSVGSALWNGAGSAIQGTRKIVDQGMVNPIVANLQAGNTGLGEVRRSGEPTDAEKLATTANKGAWNVVRQAVSGMHGAAESVADMPVKAYQGGTGITDSVKETLGLQTPEESWKNYQARQDFDKVTQNENAANPDRAAESAAVLAETVLPGQFGKDVAEGVRDQALAKIDPDISMVGGLIAPGIGEQQLLKVAAKPLAAVSKAAIQVPVKVATKIIAPAVEKTGDLMLWVNTAADRATRAASKAITGDETSIFRHIADPIKPFLYLPGQVLQKIGRVGSDLGRVIDDAGIAGRQGVFERAGKNANSSVLTQKLFSGNGLTGGVMRARMLDGLSSATGYYAEHGIRGGIVGGLLGFGNIEDPKSAGEAIGSGAGIGMALASAPASLRAGMEQHQRANEDADISRAMKNAGKETEDKLDQMADPKVKAQKLRDRATATQAAINQATGADTVTASSHAGIVRQLPGHKLQQYYDHLQSQIDMTADPVEVANLKSQQADVKAEQARRYGPTGANRTAAETEMDAAGFKPEVLDWTDVDFKNAGWSPGMIAKAKAIQARYHGGEAEPVASSMPSARTPEEVKAMEKSRDLDLATADELDKIDPNHPAVAEAKRLLKLGYTDRVDLAKPILKQAGLGDTEIKLMSAPEIGSYADSIFEGTKAIHQRIIDDPNSKPDDVKKSQDALAHIETLKAGLLDARGSVLSENGRFPIKGSVVILNSDHPDSTLRNGDFENTMGHEIAHALYGYQSARGLLGKSAAGLFATYYTDPFTGEKIKASEGLYTDADADKDIDTYLSHFSPEMRKQLEETSFADREKARQNIREERFCELMGLAAEPGQLRRKLDNGAQTAFDWAATVNLNGRLGALRDELVRRGIFPGQEGAKSSILATGLDPQSLAMIRQYQRALLNYDGRMTYQAGKSESDLDIPLTKILTNRVLQEKFKDSGIFDTEMAATVHGPDGQVLADVPVLDPSFTGSGEYTMKDGQLVDADGKPVSLGSSEEALRPTITAMPEGSKINIGNRIARNPDGTPKILSVKESESRSRDRGLLIKNAIDSVPDDGTPDRMADTGNGSYRGVMTPSQVAAVMALPDNVVSPSLKTRILKFNDALARRDGTRFIIEYQAALKGGKYRALAPRIRDVIPIGFQFSKQGNFLATTASVSRMFDKLNYLSEKNPKRLAPWGGDQTRFWQDLSTYLGNHQAGREGQVGLHPDPLMAIEKKNILNDFMNMFDKESVGTNPNRTKIPAKRGQDSPDRIIMSARMDRVNAMEESTAEKMPINYGLLKANFMPGRGKATPTDFYSRLQKGLQDERQERFTPEQAKALGRKFTNEDELKWTGFNQVVDEIASQNGGRVPKAELLSHLQNEGNVEIGEKRYGGNNALKEILPGEFEIYSPSGELLVVFRGSREAAEANLEQYQSNKDRTKFSQYVVPGGDNYREVVLTLPDHSLEKKLATLQVVPAPDGGFDVYEGTDKINTYPISTQEEALRTGRSGIINRHENEGNRPYKSSHFPDVPNYLAHYRTDDRVDADGNPGLFIEEIQSDRHQAGKKLGYQETPNSFDGKVPDAPFRKTWPIMVFKRALADAVKTGKQWIGWTSGETQAERYDLSKQVDDLRVIKTGQNSYHIGYSKNGRTESISDFDLTAEQLPDYIGKDLARRIANDSFDGDKVKIYSGVDLKIGGEGMKGFYNQILPKEIGKYAKQFGGKVERGNLEGGKNSPLIDGLKVIENNPPQSMRQDYYDDQFSDAISTVIENARNGVPLEEAINQLEQKWNPDPEVLDAIRESTKNLSSLPNTGTSIWKLQITPKMRDMVLTDGQAKFMPSVSYSMPNDPKRTMADFYLLAGMESMPWRDIFIGQSNRDSDAPIKGLRSDEFANDLQYAKEVMYPQLREKMLDAVFFAMAAELRHATERPQPESITNDPLFQQFNKYYNAYKAPIPYTNRKPLDDVQFKGSNEGYQKSYAALRRAMEKTGESRSAVARLAEKVFEQGKWSAAFGGKPWAGIARGWLDLMKADRDLNQMAVAIDHVYDLQHNTDTVFNKIQSYYDSSKGYRWIKEMLDFKANLKDFRDLMPKASGTMQKLMRPIMKEFYGEGMIPRSNPNESLKAKTVFGSSSLEIANKMLAKGSGGSVKLANGDLLQYIPEHGNIILYKEKVPTFLANNIFSTGKAISKVLEQALEASIFTEIKDLSGVAGPTLPGKPLAETKLTGQPTMSADELTKAIQKSNATNSKELIPIGGGYYVKPYWSSKVGQDYGQQALDIYLDSTLLDTVHGEHPAEAANQALKYLVSASETKPLNSATSPGTKNDLTSEVAAENPHEILKKHLPKLKKALSGTLLSDDGWVDSDGNLWTLSERWNEAGTDGTAKLLINGQIVATGSLAELYEKSNINNPLMYVLAKDYAAASTDTMVDLASKSKGLVNDPEKVLGYSFEDLANKLVQPEAEANSMEMIELDNGDKIFLNDNGAVALWKKGEDLDENENEMGIELGWTESENETREPSPEEKVSKVEEILKSAFNEGKFSDPNIKSDESISPKSELTKMTKLVKSAYNSNITFGKYVLSATQKFDSKTHEPIPGGKLKVYIGWPMAGDAPVKTIRLEAPKIVALKLIDYFNSQGDSSLGDVKFMPSDNHTSSASQDHLGLAGVTSESILSPNTPKGQELPLAGINLASSQNDDEADPFESFTSRMKKISDSHDTHAEQYQKHWDSAIDVDGGGDGQRLFRIDLMDDLGNVIGKGFYARALTQESAEKSAAAQNYKRENASGTNNGAYLVVEPQDRS